jgi:hypothetical protein
MAQLLKKAGSPGQRVQGRGCRAEGTGKGLQVAGLVGGRGGARVQVAGQGLLGRAVEEGASGRGLGYLGECGRRVRSS